MSATVLIVDDHAGFRASARRMLEADGYEVVGEAVDGSTGIAAARELQPEVVLLDVQLPDIDGAEVARRLNEPGCQTVVILVSTRPESDLGPALAVCGACGFINKEELTGAAVSNLIAEKRAAAGHAVGAREQSQRTPGGKADADIEPQVEPRGRS